jgi:DNA-directed RNA polymerase specialized sigma24 family protein
VAGKASKQVQRVIDALENIGDAADRAKAAGELLLSWPDLHRQVREVRQQAVLVMRQQGLSYAEIGRALDISKARAQQIAEGRLSGRKRGRDHVEEDADARNDDPSGNRE